MLILAGCAGPGDRSDAPFDLVDPFIGTGGHGHTFPGATLPFGMVQLSPDTRLTGWDGCSGYHYTDEVVYGFSHTHLSGTGVSDYGDVLFMPVAGEATTLNGAVDGPENGYASPFAKTSEQAEPGFYAVRLDEGPVDVELTASERTGVHRYTFPAGAEAHVVVDLAHRDKVTDSLLRMAGDRAVEGWRHSTGWARDQQLWFHATFSEPILSAGFERREGGAKVDGPAGPLLPLEPDATEAAGDDVRAVLSFGKLDRPLTVHVGLSPVDVAGARGNLEAETAGKSFDQVRAAAREVWTAALDRLTVEGGTRAQRVNFYTGVYHSLIAPNLASDVDGRYRGMDREVHVAEGRRHYTVFSLWDTFRATHPLFTLIERERTEEFIHTMLAMYREGGRLPVWELAGNETDTMIGYHAVPVIVDAWGKGIDGFDRELALEAMLQSAMRDARGLEAYKRQGFISAEDDAESVSKTLEYAFDDFCIARFAEAMGRDDIVAEFDARSQGWRHLLDPATGFMRARHNQRWIEPFDPRRVDLNYTEANSWQYSLFVPHDVEGLMAALGGEDAFVERLDALFSAEAETTGRHQVDITGLIGQYAHGNEPSHHMAWLYHYAGLPDRSAERVRQILDELYTNEPDGLSGNEDCGQMSSWYVLSSIGIYPVSPCEDIYTLGAPLFDRVIFKLESGEQFTIESPGDGQYVASVELNGSPLVRAFVRHGEILGGGTLTVRRSTGPAPDWGRGERPPSSVAGAPVPAAPYVEAPSDRFRDPMQVALAAESGASVRYAINGGRPRDYSGPFEVRDSARLRFHAETADGRRSPEVAAYLHKIPNEWSVVTTHTPNSQYTAGGDAALVDGLPGASNWRMGGWQGYQYSDFEAIVDLGRKQTLRRLGASFLQEQKSWIWMPKEVLVSVSSDGESYREVARLGHDVPDDAEGVVLREIAQRVSGVSARYVKVTALNYGPIPRWHPGHGDNAFIFVDELLIE
ncbi:hypothetical protein ABI59_09480 [Acidobacteria bacterium Mor1]|nr:hypothetical protein ABI59_09480 [Acidobacteria bacterium Mor1]